VLNEPGPPSSSSHVVLKEWYASVIKELHSLDPSIPLYIGDCWRTDEYAEFIESLPATNTEEQSSTITSTDPSPRQTSTSPPTPMHKHSLMPVLLPLKPKPVYQGTSDAQLMAGG
jgi:hypothetical protein